MSSGVSIHPTAIVGSRVELDAGVSVGAYAVLKGPLQIGAGSIIHEHSVVHGATIVGRNCTIGPGAYVGTDPQHIRFVADEADPTYLVLGDNVIVRECARLHRSTVPGLQHATKIGDGCFIMGAAHVGHDCVVEKGATVADSALLGGHCHIGENAFIGGGCTLHQFIRVGRLSIIAGNEAISHDVPPFGAVLWGRLKAYNAIGCRRAGFDRQTITAIRGVYQRLQTHRTTSAALAAIRVEVADLPVVQEVLDFIEKSRRGIVNSHPDMPRASRLEHASADGQAAGMAMEE